MSPFQGFAPIEKTDRRLKGEREILTNRVVMGSLALFICMVSGVSAYVIVAFAGYLSCNALLMVGRQTDMRPQYRWLAAILLDAIMGGAVQYWDPATMSFAYVIMIWAILGNGFRYGNRWLFVASVAMFASFGAVIALSPFWRAIPVLACSLLAGLLILPAYCSKLIASLSRATNQAETANRAKTYFLASVSHELRTPLNAIIGYASQLAEENLTPRVAGMIHSSHKAAEHLLYLIDQLLYASRSESTQAPIENVTFTLPDLLAETKEILLPQAMDKAIAFHCHANTGSDVSLNGPADMLRNIMVNLAANAIKFTATGQVIIECGVEHDADKAELWFAVEDSGVGIALEAQQRIFEPFTQADETVLDQFGGTGLGLAICKQFAERMGGRLGVDSELGKGSRFTYRGPVAINGTGDVEDMHSKIVYFGPDPIEIDGGDTLIDWHVCRDFDALRASLGTVMLECYDIAIIDDRIIDGIAPEHVLWAQFAEARTPPVLLRSGNAVDLDDIKLRAAFATVIPERPDFAALRSAVRIGCSFRNAELPSAQRELEPADTVRTTPRRILVADDNRTNREVLKTILESIGHEVHYAIDGEEALAALEELELDIVFLDVNMPKISGIEVCAIWRQIEGPRAHLPILGLTADATDETQKRCLDAGMDAHFTKPMRRVELIAAVEQYCDDDEEIRQELPSDPLGKLVAIERSLKATDSVLDSAQIKSLLEMGGEEFLASLCESYCEDVEKLLVDLDRAATDPDLEAFRFAAHAIKSSAANIGAAELSALCGKLETIAAPDFQADGIKMAACAASQARLVEKELSALTASAIRAA
ncbi:response regulator [Novosphingopyxis sp.]|uniref:hybrid sensor histidine kinase/response regulator n=1 Tax=Novosphingopyxis sp. TaxID=2709690 RepID=UPI003B591BC3